MDTQHSSAGSSCPLVKIHFWRHGIEERLKESDSNELALLQHLPPADLENLSKYRDRKARLHHLCGRLLLRHALSQVRDVQPGAWRFCYSDRGKPELAAPFDRYGLEFSISHSTGAVVCAVAAKRNIGIDVEWLGRELDACGLARRFFAPCEADGIERLSGRERALRFFSSWTLREAYIKALGAGLFHPLEGIVCEIGSRDGYPRLFDPCGSREHRDWEFTLIEPVPEYCLALCTERPCDRSDRALVESRILSFDPAKDSSFTLVSSTLLTNSKSICTEEA